MTVMDIDEPYLLVTIVPIDPTSLTQCCERFRN
jgi:hypothetical protein